MAASTVCDCGFIIPAPNMVELGSISAPKYPFNEWKYHSGKLSRNGIASLRGLGVPRN